MSLESIDPEDVIENIEDVLDEIDADHASESELRTAVRKISELIAEASEEEEEEEEEEDEEAGDEVEVDEEEEEQEVPWK